MLIPVRPTFCFIEINELTFCKFGKEFLIYVAMCKEKSKQRNLFLKSNICQIIFQKTEFKFYFSIYIYHSVYKQKTIGEQ